MQDQDRMLLGAAAFLAACHALDGATTAVALAGGARELNFFMATADGISWKNFLVIKCLGTGVVVGVSALLQKLTRAPLLAALPCVLDGVRQVYASVGNLIVAFAQYGWL